jgi:F-type H+-transporting ATPase subunit gamma
VIRVTRPLAAPGRAQHESRNTQGDDLASARDIKRRIRSVKNIAQVTRAMEMVAASRMRRAQAQTLASRPYSEKAWEVLQHLALQSGARGVIHPLLQERPVRRVGLLLITPDRGLCGGLVNNMLRQAIQFIKQRTETPVSAIAVGRKGRDFMARYGYDIRAEFTRIPDQPSILDITPIARIIMEDYINGEFDQVWIGYSAFVNTLVQRPTLRQLLPVQTGLADAPARQMGEFIYEPSPEEILAEVLPRFVEVQIYQAILESIASEQSARMVAMRSATDNARDLIDDLTLSYNKARQAGITKEMLEIAGGAEALRQSQQQSSRQPAVNQ